MGSIKDKVAIVGMGCTKFGELWDKGIDDLIIEAAYSAYEDAGIEPKDIEAAWLGVTQLISAIVMSAPLKLRNIPITRVENRCATGMEALRNASFAIAAGMYDVVLVLGVEKLKDTGLAGLPGLGDFVGEFLILLGTYQRSVVAAAMASIGVLATTFYALRFVQRTFHGPNSNHLHFRDLVPREGLVMGLMLVTLLWLGLYPQPVLNMFDRTLAKLEQSAFRR